MDFNKVKVVGITVPTIDEIPDSEGLISYTARVSNPSNQDNFATADRLLAYCAKHNHWSVFEMCNVIIEIETPRDIARQILRHRSFNFQEFCISGDSKVTTLTKSGRTKKVSIENLYKRYQSEQYWGIADNLVKVYDEKTGGFTSAKIKEVFYTGVKPVYEVTLDGGKKIKSTLEHKFLTRDGFKTLSEIEVGSFLGVNGIPVHQDKDWLLSTKEESLSTYGLQYIADKANVSYHTIRKWLKRHGISYTKKEVARYTETWNKNLSTELQPRYGKFTTEATKELMRKSARKCTDSNLYLNGNKSGENLSLRDKACQWAQGYKNKLLEHQNYRCAITGESITRENCHIDHIRPIFSNPELAFDIENIRVVSVNAHRVKSTEEMVLSKYTPSWKKVVAIKYVGEEKTYDMEVDHSSHNYIANGVVTHNSQRYSVAQDYIVREARLQDTKNRQNSLKVDDDELDYWWENEQWKLLNNVSELYEKALDKGIAKEVARTILPEGLTMSRMYMNGTVRSWMHYCQLRSGNGTQAEHIDIAKKCGALLADKLPSLAEHFNAK